LKILIIEDEKELSESIAAYLKGENYLCEIAADFNKAIEKTELYDYDCILLDITLPGGSGLEILKELKANNKMDGVLIISARNSLDDKISGLNLGADDYLTKPFHLSELNARIKALIRRKYAQGVNMLEIGNLHLDLLSRTLTCGNQPVVLTKNEYNLLVFLLNNKNRVVSKQAIAEHLYGDQAENMPSYDFVYSHIKNLKKKLKEKGCEDFVETIYGLGYKLSL